MKWLRPALCLFVLCIACPFRYWPLENGVDETWRFALNYAHAHGMQTVFTTGPLAYLIFPQNIGSNLSQGLIFQGCLWILLAAIYADVFFRNAVEIRNLVLFTATFALAAPLFWANSFGPENLILAGALALLVLSGRTGPTPRYWVAVSLVALLPLFKLTAALIGAGALVGVLLNEAFFRGKRAVWVAAFTLAVVIAGILAAAGTHSRGWLEITSGYTAGMSYDVTRTDSAGGLLTIGILGVSIWLLSRRSPPEARYYALLLAGPLIISIKHGFIRPNHAVDLVCFVALALGLLALSGGLRPVIAILFVPIWLGTVLAQDPRGVALQAIGAPGVHRFLTALRPPRVVPFPRESRIEPELLQIIGDATVASMSVSYTNLAADGKSVAVYPTVQRYCAYTPYLDGLNASWTRDHGPRFLVFDGSSIDGRDAWAETPAMWAEVYRWYDKRALGVRNLLLERRTAPRYAALNSMGPFSLTLPGEVRFPPSHEEIFWAVTCEYNTRGRLLNLVFRNPPVSMTVNGRSARVLPAVLASPVLGNFLPADLPQFAELFQPAGHPAYSVDRIFLGGAGTSSYGSTCRGEFFRPAR